MRHLVDANVLSEATKPDPDDRVVAWLRRNERSIAVDPIGALAIATLNRRDFEPAEVRLVDPSRS